MNISKFSLGIIIFTVLISVGLIYFAIIPLYDSVKAAKTEKESLASEQQKTTADLEFLRTMQQNETSINQYSARAEKLIPKDPDLQYLFLELDVFITKLPMKNASYQLSDSIASPSTSGATPSNTNSPNPSPTPTSSPKSAANGQSTQNQSLLTDLQTHSFTISGTVSYENVPEVLDKIYFLDRLAEITGINIGSDSSASSDTSSGTPSAPSTPSSTKSGLSIQITGNFFSQKSPSSDIALADSFDQTILTKAAQYLKDRISYTTPIIIEKETGFGRSNPFAPY